MAELKRLPDAELAVMQALWQAGRPPDPAGTGNNAGPGPCLGPHHSAEPGGPG